MPPLAIDLDEHPDLTFRIDSFVVPEASRPDFDAAMHRNMAFIATLPGFMGHTVFEKTGGPTAFDVTTIAVWESKAAYEHASEQVRAYYRRIGFDPPAMMARWGVRAELGAFRAVNGPAERAARSAAASPF